MKRTVIHTIARAILALLIVFIVMISVCSICITTQSSTAIQNSNLESADIVETKEGNEL